MLKHDNGTKKFLMRVYALLLCAACLITCFLSDFLTELFSSSETSTSISITYSTGSISGTAVSGTAVTKTTDYDSRLYSALLLDWDGFGSDNSTATTAIGGSGNFSDWSTSSTVDGYIPAFAGWKLTAINGTTYAGDTYIYPDNDYIYTNDAPFSSYESITSLTFEAVWGKTVYLRDQYNFTDLGNVYGDDSGIAIAKINWDTSTTYASDSYDGKQAEAVAADSKGPVASLSRAYTLLGTTGGKIVIVNHYTFEAPDGYYYTDWADSNGATYDASKANSATNNVTTTSTYYYDFGESVTTGIVTISGLNEGVGTTSSSNMSEGRGTDTSNYTNAHLYMKQTRGNGWYLSGSTKTTYDGLTIRLRFNSDTVIEGLNILNYRESYNRLRARATNDQYLMVYDDNRLVIEDTVTSVKRTTAETNYGYDTTNWLYTSKTNSISGNYTGSDVTCAAASVTASSGLCIGYANSGSSADTGNRYLTLHGDGCLVSSSSTTPTKIFLATVYIGVFSTAAALISSNTLNNIHINIEDCYITSLYPLYTTYGGTVNFIGLSLYNVRASTIATEYGAARYSTTSFKINEYVSVVGGNYSGSTKLTYTIANFYVGVYNTTSSGYMGEMELVKAGFYMEGDSTYSAEKITNFYGGGNTVTCKSTGTFNFYISGGTITNFYGGGFGGYMGDSSNACDINIDMTGGTVESMYGGGAGGVVQLSASNGPISLATYSIGYDETAENYWGGDQSYYPSYAVSGSTYYKLNPCNNLSKPYVIYETTINGETYTVVRCLSLYYQGSDGDYDNFVNYYKDDNRYTVSDAAVYADIDIKISGGTISSNVYGGGKNGSVTGDINIEVTGGTIKGSVYGGGYGNDTDFTDASNKYTTYTYGSTTIQFYFTADTSKAEITANSNASTSYTIDLFSNVASASGTSYSKFESWLSSNYSSATPSEYHMTASELISSYGNDVYVYCDTINLMGKITGDVTINISGGSIERSVYGGSFGAVASISGNTNINISGGSIAGSVYGGGYAGAVTGSTAVTLSGGTITNNIYGGGYSASVGTDGANPANSTTVTITSGTVSNVYGGGYQGAVYGNTIVNITGASSSITTVYGGGYGSTASVTTANVTISNGTIGYVYGGGYAGTAGATSVTMSGGTVSGTLYGGGNQGTAGATSVTMSGGSVGEMYGGGNAGAVGTSDDTTAITVTVTGGSITTLYGGCNAANVSGNITVNVSQATSGATTSITTLYGGNNASGSISGSVGVTVSQDSGTTTIGTLYGGGNAADYSGTCTVTVNGGTIGTLYGGGLSASVGNTAVTMGGTVTGSMYGGGYNGAVGGTTTVSVSGSVGSGNTGNIYGGGLNGAVAGAASVTLNGGSVTGSVYGGGYGSTATVASASVSVTSGSVGGSIYGGGENGNVTGNTEVAVNGTVTGSIYGGGYNGDVGGTTSVTVSGGTIGIGTTGSVYGGGYEGAVTGSTAVTVSSGTIADSVVGGGYNGDIGTSASASSTTVTVTGGTMTSVYGGGYYGDIYGTTTVTISDTTTTTVTISGSVYGAGYGEESCVTAGTTVTIDLIYSFTATETSVTTGTVTSGEITTTITETAGTTYSEIIGNVYGGGNLGTVGAGTINTSTNTVSGVTAATTSVTVVSGHIGGSVYGGGYGVPESGTYNIYMGTVFGKTTVVIGGSTSNSSDYVYIVGNVFGGGSQSRVYASDTTAATVTISSASGCNIALGGSVFGGGERGNDATTNASVATTVGDVKVKIIGNSDKASTIYFVKGGVYGDGNLCLVSGERTIEITNLNTGSRTSGNLKTFYSLQRADTATLDNTQIVLLGAVDLVAEGDTTTYSINRITTLNLTNGSTIKLDRIVNYLGTLTSDVYNDRLFIYNGYNGSNNYNPTPNTISALEDSEINAYIVAAVKGTTFSDGYNAKYTNMVCVANGLSLELRNTDGTYGTVTGLFTLSLLYANEGEGGGFVYADITNSTGDFICITGYADSYTEVAGLDASTFAQGIYYTRSGTVGSYEYTEADSFSNSTTYYKRDYMTVVDDVGGYSLTTYEYTYYYWYIQGSTISYTLEVTGYIGSTTTDYDDSGTVPQHTEERYYVLNGIVVESGGTLASAVTGNSPTYELVQTSMGLTGQQISIEVMVGSTSLGFLCYNSGWGIYVDSNHTCYGTTTGGSNNAVSQNLLTLSAITVEKGYDSIYLILHKSESVSTETKSMTVTLTIDLYVKDGGGNLSAVSGGTSQLILTSTLNIVRLVPTQTIYKTTGKNYAGIYTSATSINITTGSSFTVQYQTKYIPAAFTSTATNTSPIVWALSAEGFAYYTDSSGNYLTINTTTNTCAGISSILTYSGETSPTTVSLWTVYKDSNGYYYYYTSYTNAADNTKVTMNDLSTQTDVSTIPAGTKITMIDMTSGSAVYYYYICSSDTTNINLDDFMVMGSTTTIKNLSTTPAYKAAYDATNANSQVTENLIFIFDFENVADTYTGTFRIQLQHMYSKDDDSYAIDMMDFVQSSTDGNVTTYTRTVPQPVVYTITNTNGLTLSASFGATSYYDIDTAVLTVTITEDTTNINTRLSENEYAIKIELVSYDGGTVYSFPVGMQFQYVNNGKVYTISASGNYVIIPIETSGTHTINIINELFSLKDIVGGTAYFRVTLYSAPDASYYNNIKWCSTTANSLSYEIKTNLTYALSVTAATGTTNGTPQVLTAGDTLNFTVKTCCNGSSTDGVTVTLMKKNDSGDYEAVALSSLFTNSSSSISASTSGADYGWMVSSTADTGTYRLVFTYGDHTEYLNVIVY